jgi:hypothetical protein
MLGDYIVKINILLSIVIYNTKQKTFLLFLIPEYIKQKQDNPNNHKNHNYKP